MKLSLRRQQPPQMPGPVQHRPQQRQPQLLALVQTKPLQQWAKSYLPVAKMLLLTAQRMLAHLQSRHLLLMTACQLLAATTLLLAKLLTVMQKWCLQQTQTRLLQQAMSHMPVLAQTKHLLLLLSLLLKTRSMQMHRNQTQMLQRRLPLSMLTQSCQQSVGLLTVSSLNLKAHKRMGVAQQMLLEVSRLQVGQQLALSLRIGGLLMSMQMQSSLQYTKRGTVSMLAAMAMMQPVVPASRLKRRQ